MIFIFKLFFQYTKRCSNIYSVRYFETIKVKQSGVQNLLAGARGNALHASGKGPFGSEARCLISKQHRWTYNASLLAHPHCRFPAPRYVSHPAGNPLRRKHAFVAICVPLRLFRRCTTPDSITGELQKDRGGVKVCIKIGKDYAK